MQPVITIFCAFTRNWAVERWLANLEAVEHDPALTNLCFVVDIDDQQIARQLTNFAEAGGYRSFHMKINENWHPNEVKLAIRRMRVADVKNQSKDLIAKTDGDIIIGFEDDTVFDRLKSFEPLYKPLEDTEVGFVTGVQMGRWGARIVGIWAADNLGGNPTHVETLLPKTGLEPISAGGFYGYATRRALYLEHEYFTSSGQPWGPDVNFGFWLTGSKGLKCLVDWDLIYGHNDHNIIAYPDDPKHAGKLVQVVYNKDNSNGKWQRTDYEQDRY